MKCLECEFSNRQGARFCSDCGAPLPIACPVCGARNRPLGKFCDQCGSGLSPGTATSRSAPSLEEKLKRIQRYLPADVTEKILAQKDRIEGERREVTIMFCDMKEFTPLTEKLGPDETFALMDQVFEILIQKVNDYQGTVNELRGDGILAYFGAPIALEDAPQRAIRSALAIHREMIRFNERIKEQWAIPPLLLRIGINTGPVVVGAVGNDLRVQFTAMGDTINMASRMETLAEPGTTFVTEETFRLTEGFFRFESLGEKKVKGKDRTIPVYRVIAPSSRRTRFDVSTERGLAPFVGRARELDFIMGLFLRVREGFGQALSIISEAGVGKSRLLYEFRKAMIQHDVAFLEGKCLSYSRSVVYHPILDILRTAFGIRDEDKDSHIQEKVRAGLGTLEADLDTTLPFLLEMLSVKESGVDKISMSPESKKERILEALRRIVINGSRVRPLILAFEDLHWIDKSSEDAIKDLLDHISGVPVFIVLTYRPDYHFACAGKPYHSQITLNRLSHADSLKIVCHFAGPQAFDTQLKNVICEKTEGIPLFIEEYMRGLASLGGIEKNGDICRLAHRILYRVIPSTIQEIIMARVDALQEGSREVIQTGAAIEREFSYALIREILDLEENELLGQLRDLKEAGLIYERGIHPESTFVFKHAVIQEVIYESILKRKKRTLHQRIGRAIETLYEETLETYYEILARHFSESDDLEKGAEYCHLAARKSEKKASFPEAIAFCEKQLACLEELSRSMDVSSQLIDTRTTLGLYYIQMNYHDEAKRVVEPSLALALEGPYRKRLAQIYTILGSYHFIVEEDFEKAIHELELALCISNEVGHVLCLFLSNFWMGFALVFTCDFDKALKHWRSALDINEAADSLWGVSVVKSAMAWALAKQGNIRLSHETSVEALRLAQQSGDIFSKAYAFGGNGISLFHKGELEKALDSLREGTHLCDRISYFSMGSLFHGYLGDALYHLGDFGGAEASLQKAVDLGRRSKFVASLNHLYELMILKSRLARCQAVDMEAVFACTRQNRIRINDGALAYHVAEILLMRDRKPSEEAGQWIGKAIEHDQENGMTWYLGQDHLLAAAYWKQREDPGKARYHLSLAGDLFKKSGADGWAVNAQMELKALQ